MKKLSKPDLFKDIANDAIEKSNNQSINSRNAMKHWSVWFLKFLISYKVTGLDVIKVTGNITNVFVWCILSKAGRGEMKS